MLTRATTTTITKPNNMLHCVNTSGNLGWSCSDMTVLEGQRTRRKWQQRGQSNHYYHHQEEEQQQGLFCGTGYNDNVFCSPSSSSSPLQVQNNPQGMMMMMMTTTMMDGGNSSALCHSVKPDPGKLDNMAFGSSSSSAVSRTCSSPRGRDLLVLSTEKTRESAKKRKAENPKVVAENDGKDKRVKVSGGGGGEEESSKVTEQNNSNINKKNAKSSTSKNNKETTSVETCKENSKGSEVQNQKPDYIHVRARRGQATDSHSLAERVRREKISERMKYLQELVPGCNKITGKAGMLDEIINYVQSLQRQVEFLSMKLAAVNPRLDFNIDDLFAKEVFPTCAPSFPTIGMPSEMTSNPAAYLDFYSAQQLVSCCGGLVNNMGMNPCDMGLRRSISAPVSFPETFLDSSPCFTQQMLPSSSTWEGDFQVQNLHNVAFDEVRTSTFPSQPFTGLVEASNLKMEM